MAELRFPNEGSIPEFLAALASSEGTHGVVSAAAVAGAMGASLLQMVATLPQTLPGDDDDPRASAAAALVRIQEEFLETVETETAVKLFAARNMPHSGEAERVRREDAIQLALRAAADVPLEVMRLSVHGLQHAASLAGRSPRAASADVELAVALLETACNGARSSLEAKLPSLTDAVHVTSLADRWRISAVTRRGRQMRRNRSCSYPQPEHSYGAVPSRSCRLTQSTSRPPSRHSAPQGQDSPLRQQAATQSQFATTGQRDIRRAGRCSAKHHVPGGTRSEIAILSGHRARSRPSRFG